MAEFDSHKWTREFKEAQVDQAKLGEVDYSTMRLKSNIDQKWSSAEDMKNDLRQWVRSTYVANGVEAMDPIETVLEDLLKVVTGMGISGRR